MKKYRLKFSCRNCGHTFELVFEFGTDVVPVYDYYQIRKDLPPFEIVKCPYCGSHRVIKVLK
ncbi:MAG: hypothetical protein ACTSVE_00150 [Candidatus Helarchaeota archaeon]